MKKIQVPAIFEEYQYAGQPKGTFAKDVGKALSTAMLKYGTFIRNASTLTGTPAQVSLAFMVIENMQLNPNVVSGAGAIGLMQVTPNSAAYTLYKQSKNLDAANKAFIARFVNIYSNGKVKSETQLQSGMAALLKNPEFNIYIGTLMLGQYMTESERKYGEYRLDHAIIKYNSGIGNFAKIVDNKGLGNADTATLYKQVPFAETKGYLLKVLGQNGSLHQTIVNGLV